MAVSWAMPPALYPRSIQVSRLLKGLHLRGWRSTVVTRRTDNLATGEFLDHGLAELAAPYYTVAPIEADNDQEWIDRTVATVKELDRAAPAEALITFAQPWRDHLAGLELAFWRGRRPWIAHFSDPWVDSQYYSPASPEQRALDCERESRIISQADAVVFTNAHAADLVMAKYPQAWRDKASVVPHAMDRATMPRVSGSLSEPARRLRMAYVGNLAGQRNAAGLFEALALLAARRPVHDELELTFVSDPGALFETRENAKAWGMAALATYVPTVSHGESLAAMAAADVLLLIDAPAERNVFLPSKFADYLMADKPILGLTSPIGASADALREIGHHVVDPVDATAIADAIEQKLREHAAGKLSLPKDAVAKAERYSVDATAAAFESIIEGAIERRRR